MHGRSKNDYAYFSLLFSLVSLFFSYLQQILCELVFQSLSSAWEKHEKAEKKKARKAEKQAAETAAAAGL